MQVSATLRSLAPQSLDFKAKVLDKSLHQQSKQALLQQVIESFMDGILILNDLGEWIHANQSARRLCRQLTQCTTPLPLVPQEIWRVCELLIKSCEAPNPPSVLESEIIIPGAASIRLRVRWLDAIAAHQSLLLVTLEDQQQTILNRAIAETQKYHLTPRESEVWLLHQNNYSYKEIAAQLYITLNTVKRHMKSIYAKQKTVMSDGSFSID